MSKINYDGIYAPKGPRYKKPKPLPKPDPPQKYDKKGKKIKTRSKDLPVGGSYYTLPILLTPGRAAGNSRRHGDAPHEVQKKSIDAIIEAAKKQGLSQRETAHVLAIAFVESGFNPDAAAGTTTATSLGQFIRPTGWYYGLNDTNRFEINPNADALVRHYIENKDKAIARGNTGKEIELKIYVYHHDGAGKRDIYNPNSEGLRISKEQVIPLTDKFEQYLNGKDFTLITSKSVAKPINSKHSMDKKVITPSTDRIYIVKPGDTLTKISRVYNVPIGKILKANPEVTNINIIHVGQKLIIPANEKYYISGYHNNRHSTVKKPKIGVVDKQPWWGEAWLNRMFKTRWF